MEVERLERCLGIDARRQRSQYEKLFDPLTGLPGWALSMDRMEMEMARAHRTNRQLAVLVIDTPRPVDGSRHDVIRFARRLRSEVRPDDTVARTGSETFVVICNEIERGDDVLRIARRLFAGMGVSCGLGVALGNIGDSADDLMVGAAEKVAG